MTDLIVIGTGPAGITAAIYAVRAGLGVTVIAKDGGALAKADKIENYYGFAAPITGKELLNNGIEQAKRLGVTIVSEEVFSLSYNGAFVVKTKIGEYSAKSVVLATGAVRNSPAIKNLTEFEGSGVSYCAICDGFFFRKKRVAVLGAGEYARSEAAELIPLASKVYILTNGREIAKENTDTEIIEDKIASLEGGIKLEKVVFNNGKTLDIDGLFIAVGTASSSDLAKKIGAVTENGRIITDSDMQTNIPGLFAAGDCVGGLKQISKAVRDGAVAGNATVNFLRAKK